MAQITLESAAIKYPVVPVHEILECYASVEYVSWQRVQAKCTREDDGGFRVTINSRMCEYSYEWPYAHELGHIVLGHYVFDDIQLTELQEDVLCDEADQFAKELLMPEVWMREQFESEPILSFRDLRRYVQGYGVSWYVLKRRLVDLGLCSMEYIRAL